MYTNEWTGSDFRHIPSVSADAHSLPNRCNQWVQRRATLSLMDTRCDITTLGVFKSATCFKDSARMFVFLPSLPHSLSQFGGADQQKQRETRGQTTCYIRNTRGHICICETRRRGEFPQCLSLNYVCNLCVINAWIKLQLITQSAPGTGFQQIFERRGARCSPAPEFLDCGELANEETRFWNICSTINAAKMLSFI